MITPVAFKSSHLVDGFPSELRVARVTFETRAREHDAGQIAARAALEALIGPCDAEIVRASDGAPVVRGLADPPLVSISHGHRAAIAVVGRVQELGVDLCDRADAQRVRRVALRFIRPTEVELVTRDDAWPILWALKEAGAKALRHGLLDGGLRATMLAALEPARFAWPEFAATVVGGDDDVVAVVYR